MRSINLKAATILPLLFGIVWAVPGLPADDKARPNVLFIAVDDLRPELGCYGEKAIHTPNIDRLAESGVTFTRAYCQQAVCNPSRASIMTGLRPDSTRVWDLVTDFRETVPDVVTLPQHFRQNGYAAVAYGKIYHGPIPDPKSWDEPNHWPQKARTWSDKAVNDLAAFREEMRAEGKSDAAIKRLRAVATEAQDFEDGQTPDGEIADQAIARLEKLAAVEKPFFLAVGFIRPHLPFVAPKKYWDLYEREALELAKNGTAPLGAPKEAMNTMYELRDYMDFLDSPHPKEGTLSESDQRRLKHGYYASVSMVDAYIGRLLETLDATGKAEETVVVLWGDHGWKLGEHGSWCKQTSYEIDTRAPLIIRAPGAKGHGQKARGLVEFVDVYPTLAELAGLPAPKHLEGVSLVSMLDDPGKEVKSAAFSQFPRRSAGGEWMGYAMRTDGFRYVEWKDRASGNTVAQELYDHSNDSGENLNVAGEDAHAERVKELSAALWKALPEPPKVDGKTESKGRPKLVFENRRESPVTVYWLPPEGERRKSAVIGAGDTWTSNTTLGHRFLIEGEDGFRKEVVVKRHRQRVAIEGDISNRKRPNILVLMGDDWSWPHAGTLGDKVVKTPTFDSLVREGVLFEHAFVSAPSCTPSRMAVATGQYHWRLGEGANLGGSLAADVAVYPEILEAAGYRIGFSRKGAEPSKHTYRKRDPFGERFKNFEEFLEKVGTDKPFCFWYRAGEPHRPYAYGIGAKNGKRPEDVEVPPSLPDNDIVRNDLCDYYHSIERFDRDSARMLAALEKLGELENTIVVMAGDNGMPFPRFKSTLYDGGTRVPLVIRWGNGHGEPANGGRRVTDFVSLCDLAPTFLEAAGLEGRKEMTGQSLMGILKSEKAGKVEKGRRFVLTGLERHVQENPGRAIRTANYLYIQNREPERWSTGEAKGERARFDFTERHWPSVDGAFSFNVDPSPTKQWMLDARESGDERVMPLVRLSFGRKGEEELFDVRKDPWQTNNVAGHADYAEALEKMREMLANELAR